MLLLSLHAVVLSLPSPHHVDRQLTTRLSHVHSGLQVLLPDSSFSRNTTITEIKVRVHGRDSPLAFQVWHPLGDDNYVLRWNATFPRDPTMTRSMDEVRYRDRVGVAVEAGDIFGLLVLPSEGDPISVEYYEQEARMYYMEGVERSFCHLAVCNDSFVSVTNAGPSIHFHSK